MENTVPSERSTLGPALAALTAATEHLAVWHSPGRSAARVWAGRDAVAAIDAAIRALHEARNVLVGEIQADDVDRAARVEDFMARLRAERFGSPDGWHYRRDADDAPETAAPARPGAWGFKPEGAR